MNRKMFFLGFACILLRARSKKVIVSTLALLLSLSFFPQVSTTQQADDRNYAYSSACALCVHPPTIAEPFSTNFAVDINIENVTSLAACQIWLKFDPQLLSFVDRTEGDFLKTGGLTDFGFSVNQTEGTIYIASFLLGGSPVSGSGTLAEVTFCGSGLGECALDLFNTKIAGARWVSTPPYLGDANGDMIVNINDAAIVTKAWGTSPGDPKYNPNADFNKDGFVDFFDLVCVTLNWGYYEENEDARESVEITHEIQDGYVNIYSPTTFYVTWKWLDPYGDALWLTENVTLESVNPTGNFNFNQSSGHINFNLASVTAGSCNVTIPRLLMDGAFKVLIDDEQVLTILTWNKTHTFIYFPYGQGSHNIAIIGDMVTRVRSLDLLTLSDVNGDGKVDIQDIFAVARRYQWKEDR